MATPEIPNIPMGTPKALHEFLRKMKEVANILAGKQGNLADRAVTFQDLIDLGFSSASGESVGWSGWFDDGTNFRVTVKSGIITDVSDSDTAGHS